jgi:hypothetical protein
MNMELLFFQLLAQNNFIGKFYERFKEKIKWKSKVKCKLKQLDNNEQILWKKIIKWWEKYKFHKLIKWKERFKDFIIKEEEYWKKIQEIDIQENPNKSYKKTRWKKYVKKGVQKIQY